MAIVPDQSPSAIDEDFGANDWLLEEMYEQYSADPSSVDETWAAYFRTHGAPKEPNGRQSQPGRDSGRAKPLRLRGPPSRDGPPTGRRPLLARLPPRRRPSRRPTPPRPPSAQGRPPGVRRPSSDRPQSKDTRPTSPGARGGVPADPPNPANRPNVVAGGPGPDHAQGRPGPHREEHGRLADRADRHQRPLAAGQAADRPARGDQQPPAPGPRRQGVLHPPDRLRDGAGPEDAPGDEQRLRRRSTASRPWSCRAHVNLGLAIDLPRPDGTRQLLGAEHQELRDAGLRPVLDRVRADGQEGAGRAADRRGLRRHHDHPDQPGHHRHQPLGARG